MKPVLLAALALLAPLVGAASPPAGPAFPSFRSAAEVGPACDQGLARARASLEQLVQRAVDGGWLAAYDDFLAEVEDAFNPVDFLVNVHPDVELRAAADACALRWTEFNTRVAQNEALYRALVSAPVADAVEAELVHQARAEFEDAGVNLPAAQRQRALQILDQLGELEQAFARHIQEPATRVAFTEAELEGVPAAVWADAPRDAQGRWLLGVDDASYLPVLRGAESAAARERMWRARTNQGGEANLDLLARVVGLRREYAALLGATDYVDFKLRRRMAHDGDTVARFLDAVGGAVEAREREELAELRALKARHLGRPLAQTVIRHWDVSYYGELLRRERFEIDQELFRPYFPAEHALPFVMRVIETLMGVRYTRVAVPLWHPSVQAYVVSDAASGELLGQLYVDPYPRAGKYSRAAVWPLRGSATRSRRSSTAALVVNLNRQGLTLDELAILLHEFGHAVHVNLSRTRFAAQAGTQVMRDFVEAPSQMLEDWAYDSRVLALMPQVCASCLALPEELLAQAIVARDVGKGGRFGRQRLYAAYDLALHRSAEPDPLGLWARMEGATPLGHVPGSRFPAGFAHIAGSYGAGYYGYLWSLVVATDLRTAFAADRLDPVVGRRYRDAVLAPGAQRPAPELVKAFLGRESSAQAFFDELRK